MKELWGGELPEFSDIDAANELIGALVMGRHPDRAVPLSLCPETQEGLHRLSLIRSQEIDGFVHGLFGSEEWRSKVIPIIEQNGGRFVVRSDNVDVLEGDLKVTNIAIIEFADRATLNARESS